jgi:hypothetical protein
MTASSPPTPSPDSEPSDAVERTVGIFQPSSGTAIDASTVTLNAARKSWEFHCTDMGWDHWVTVGHGLKECVRLALMQTGCNDMTAHPAKMAMRAILEREGLDAINKGDRSVLLKIMEVLPAVTKWRLTLTTTARLRYNHPRTVWQHYQKSTITSKTGGYDGAPATRFSYKTAYAEAEAKNAVLEQRLRSEGDGWRYELIDDDAADVIACDIFKRTEPTRAEQIAHSLLHLVGASPAAPLGDATATVPREIYLHVVRERDELATRLSRLEAQPHAEHPPAATTAASQAKPKMPEKKQRSPAQIARDRRINERRKGHTAAGRGERREAPAGLSPDLRIAWLRGFDGHAASPTRR